MGEDEALERQQRKLGTVLESSETVAGEGGGDLVMKGDRGGDHMMSNMQIDEDDDPLNPECDVLAEVQIKLITTMLDLRLFREAERILEKLLEEDEEDVQCWYLTALLHISEGSKEK